MRKYLLLLFLLPLLISFTWNGATISTWNGATISTWNGATISSCSADLSSSFAAVTGATVSTSYESNTVTVTLTELCSSTAPISVSGGEYKINSGSYTSSSGVVSTGNTVTVRQTSSGSNYTKTTATITIGGGSHGYEVTTILGAPTGVAATAGDSQVSIAYTGATGASTYNGYWGTSSGACSGKTKVTGIGSSPWVLTSLTNGTPYYFNITDVDANSNESVCSSEVASTPHVPDSYQFGNNYTTGTPFGVVDSYTTRLYYERFIAPNTATIDSIRIYASTSGYVKVGLFDTAGGYPHTLLASQTVSTAVTAGQWNTIDLTTPYTVTAGGYYFIAVLGDRANIFTQYATGGGTLGTMNVALSGGYDGYAWPNDPPVAMSYVSRLCITAWGHE